MELTDEHYAAVGILHEGELEGLPITELASRIGVGP